jgi:hypothetical protein
MSSAANNSSNATSSSTTRKGAVDESEYAPSVGAEMADADQMGVFSDAHLLESNPKLRDMIDNDPRFSEEAIQRRAAERAAQGKQGGQKTLVSGGGEPLPDVIALGFCKLVFEYISALKTRFPRRDMIVKVYEMYWQIAEKAPTMPYEKFRDLLDGIGTEMLNRACESDAKLARKVASLRERIKQTTAPGDGVGVAAAADKKDEHEKASEQYRTLVSDHGIKLFEDREQARKALGDDVGAIEPAANAALFNEYEIVVVRHLVEKVHLFRFAALDQVWCQRLDLTTRDRNCAYVLRLLRTCALINNFNPEMRSLINKISVDSLNSVKGRDKRSIDINSLLEELQDRILADDSFMEAISDIAEKQANRQ